MAGTDQQAAELSRTLASIAAQMNSAGNQMINAADNMAAVLRKVGSSSSVQADSFDRGMDKFIRTLESQIQKAGDVITNTKLDQAVNRERAMFERRLNNQSFFFYETWQLNAAEARQRAEHLKESEQLHQRKLKEIQKQITDEEAEKQKLSDAYKEQEKQLRSRADTIASIQSKVDAKSAAYSTAQAALFQTGLDGTQKEIETAQTLADLAKRELEEEQKRLDEEQKLHDDLKAGMVRYVANIHSINKNLTALSEQIPLIEASMAETQVELTKAVDEFRKVDVKGAVGRMTENFINAMENTGYFGVAMGVQGIFTQIQTGLNRSVGILDVWQQAQVSQLNMSPTEFMEMTGEYRRGMLAAGGMTESLNTLSATAQQLDGNVASRAEAAKFAAQQMEMFANMGVRPTTDRVRAMGETFKSIHAVTGMTLEEFNTSMRDIMENEESMYQMRLATTEAERVAIADSVAARYRENRLRGISEEQTRAMLKKQMEMQNQRPKSRFQQAVKQAALAGAMGISGGDEMIRLAMKPASMLTEEENRRMAEFQNQLNQGIMSGLGSSNFGTQLYTEALADKTGYDERGMAVFNTAQAQSAMGDPQAAAETMGQIGEIGQTINETVQRGLGILKNPIIQLTGGIALLVPVMMGHSAAMVAHTVALFKGSKSFDGLLDKVKGWFGRGGGRDRGGGIDFPPIDGVDDTRDRGTRGRLGQIASRAGGSLMNAGRAGLGILGGVTAGGVAAASAAGIGIAGAGQALVGEDGILRGGSGNNFVNDVVNGLVQKATGEQGQTLGGLIYDWMNPPQADSEVAKATPNIQQVVQTPTAAVAPSQQSATARAVTPTTPAKIAEPTSQRDDKVTDEEKKAEDETDKDRLSIAQTIENQIKHLTVATEANNYLKTVADNVPTLVDLANRQLIAMTLTEKEKERNRDSVRKSSGLAAASFQYL